MTTGKFVIDYRLGGFPRYYISREDDSLMQVPEEIKQCVAFLCFTDREGVKLAGTAFFVAVGMKEINYTFGYAVTAKHVITDIQKISIDGKILLRVNTKEGPSEFVETQAKDWRFHPGDPYVDVAVLPLWLPQDKFDFLPIPVEMVATEQIIKDLAIGAGDEVFLTGLFVNHFGHERNLPIVRTGNIALMPEEPVQTELGPMEAFLVEARSIGGLSGSPVFVHPGVSRFLEGKTKTVTGRIPFYWLGLMHGHWRVDIQGQDSLDRSVFSREYVNMGIAIVVPVSKILEVINQEDFMKAREKQIKDRQKGSLPTPDTAQADFTKENFERLIKKAAQPFPGKAPAPKEGKT